MKFIKIFTFIATLFLTACCAKNTNPDMNMEKDCSKPDMLIRISEIEVNPKHLNEYLEYAKNVGQESVEKEPGVICIFPMIQQRDSCQIRILEIYNGQDSYQNHLQTPWFKTYKQETLHMVKSLDLVDMTAMNPAAMSEIFLKMNNKNKTLKP